MTDYELLESKGAYSLWDNVEFDPENQTGGDWYRMLLSASLGGKVIEGLACSGTSEVLCKTTHAFAANHAAGSVKVTPNSKAIEAIDREGKIVASTNRKFRGVTKANSFVVATEDVVWNNSHTTRVKTASVLAASMTAMGVSSGAATVVASQILGEEIDERITDNVIIPLSTLKHEAASDAKRKNTVFYADHVVQTIQWEDTTLQSRLVTERDAVDWGRITAIAKYIGIANAEVDPDFVEIASSVGVPYLIIKDHWAEVSTVPYIAAGTANIVIPDGMPNLHSTAISEEIITTLVNSIKVTLADLDTDSSTVALKDLLSKMRKVKTNSAPKLLTMDTKTDVLAGVIAHKVDAKGAAKILIGTDSAYNAIRDSIITIADDDPTVQPIIAKYALLTGRSRDEEKIVILKEFADKVITNEMFVAALARLSKTLGDINTAKYRLSKAKRSLLMNSSAWSDRVRVTSTMMPQLKTVLVPALKYLTRGNAGMMLPPKAMVNPDAVILVSQRADQLKLATEYLEEAKAYWINRYEMSSETERKIKLNKDMAVKYATAAKALKMLKPEWLMSWSSNYIPVELVKESYVYASAKAYIRKRAEYDRLIEPRDWMTAMDYAEHLDIYLRPDVSFVSVLEFVTGKIHHLAGDFIIQRVFTPEEEAEKVAKKARIDAWDEDAVAKIFRAMEERSGTFSHASKVTLTNVKGSWTDMGDCEAAARANNFKDFDAAFKALGEKAAFDDENEFTRTWFASVAEKEQEDIDMGEGMVI